SFMGETSGCFAFSFMGETSGCFAFSFMGETKGCFAFYSMGDLGGSTMYRIAEQTAVMAQSLYCSAFSEAMPQALHLARYSYLI
ncbi:MAG: hypothetical protein ACLFWZ_25730, partial [Coleofasciculus sp.]